MAFYAVLGIILWVFLAFWPAIVARRKGHSFVLFFLLAIVISWLLALIVSYAVKDRNETSADRAANRAAEQELEKEDAAV